MLGALLIPALMWHAAIYREVGFLLPFKIIAGVFGIAAVIYVGVFFASALILSGGRILVGLRCPVCNRSTHHRFAVGQMCEHCGSELASWLYV
jgi:hypothetical protein